MSDEIPLITLQANRWYVSSPELKKLNAIDQTHVLWTLHDWCKHEMARLVPLIMDKPDQGEAA